MRLTLPCVTDNEDSTPDLPPVRTPPTRTALRDFFAGGDPLLVHVGGAGEWLVARVRLGIIGALLLVPLVSWVIGGGVRDDAIGLLVTGAALAVAAAVAPFTRRDRYRPWVSAATTVLDVTLVSLALVSFLVFGTPHIAVNSRVVFDVYFLAIFATGLRYDARLCLLAGTLAVLEYMGIVAWAAANYDLNSPVYAPFVYGEFDWATQVSRSILLLLASGLSTAAVIRAQQLRRLSTVDRLTGVYNRGYFDERLNAELSRARRQGEPLAVVMLDVDHFKRFNDTFGHAAGNAALRTVSWLVRHAVRRSDVVARYGGEEFVMVLPATDLPQALAKTEHLRQAVARHGIRLPKQQSLAYLTISLGVAVYPADGVSADDLLDRADERLFQAKQAGRNRVVGPDSPTPRPAAPRQGPAERWGGIRRTRTES